MVATSNPEPSPGSEPEPSSAGWEVFPPGETVVSSGTSESGETVVSSDTSESGETVVSSKPGSSPDPESSSAGCGGPQSTPWLCQKWPGLIMGL